MTLSGKFIIFLNFCEWIWDSGIVVKCFKNHFVARLVTLILHFQLRFVCWKLRSYKHFPQKIEKRISIKPDALAFVKMQQCALHSPFTRKMQWIGLHMADALALPDYFSHIAHACIRRASTSITWQPKMQKRLYENDFRAWWDVKDLWSVKSTVWYGVTQTLSNYSWTICWVKFSLKKL